MTFGLLTLSAAGEERADRSFRARAENLLKDAMKTVEETKTGLPSFETEWPEKVETEREPAAGGTNGAPRQLHQILQSRIWEKTGRAFQGYDSPLAG